MHLVGLELTTYFGQQVASLLKVLLFVQRKHSGKNDQRVITTGLNYQLFSKVLYELAWQLVHILGNAIVHRHAREHVCRFVWIQLHSEMPAVLHQLQHGIRYFEILAHGVCGNLYDSPVSLLLTKFVRPL